MHNSDHMGEEERQDLADFRQRSLELRHEIALKFIRYQSQKAAGGIKPVDKDPQEYVVDRGPGPETDSEKRATKMAEAAAEGRPPTSADETKTSSKEAAEQTISTVRSGYRAPEAGDSVSNARLTGAPSQAAPEAVS